MNVFLRMYLLYSYRYRVPAIKRVLVRDSTGSQSRQRPFPFSLFIFSFLGSSFVLFFFFSFFFVLRVHRHTVRLINARTSKKTTAFSCMVEVSLRTAMFKISKLSPRTLHYQWSWLSRVGNVRMKNNSLVPRCWWTFKPGIIIRTWPPIASTRRRRTTRTRRCQSKTRTIGSASNEERVVL